MAVWVNLHLPGVKQIVQSAVRPLAGVYLIVNLVTGTCMLVVELLTK